MLEQLRLLFSVLSLVMILIALPMILKKIKPNPFYGFRTPKTMSSPEIWYDINAYSGWGFLISGIVTLIVSLIVPSFVTSLDIYSVLVCVVMLIGLIITMILTVARMRKF